MLPMPIVGLTKTIGGRAQRFMCHGHRSRIQVMCHSTDIFPQTKLGLAMSDAIHRRASARRASTMSTATWTAGCARST